MFIGKDSVQISVIERHHSISLVANPIYVKASDCGVATELANIVLCEALYSSSSATKTDFFHMYTEKNWSRRIHVAGNRRVQVFWLSSSVLERSWG